MEPTGRIINTFGDSSTTFHFFPSAVHKLSVHRIASGLESRCGLVLLTGEIGTGKTTLCKYVQEWRAERFVFAELGNPFLTPAEQIHHFCREFGLPESDTLKAGISALEHFFHEQYEAGKLPVLIYDESHLLAKDHFGQIQIFSNLRRENKPLVQVLLVGQIELLARLKEPGLESLNQRIGVRCELEALNDADTQRYIDFKLSLGGADNVASFDPRSYKEVWKLTRGVPRLINHACSLLMDHLAFSGQTRVTPEIVKRLADDGMYADLFSAPVPWRARWGKTGKIILGTVLSLVVLLAVWLGLKSVPLPLGDYFFDSQEPPANTVVENSEPVEREQGAAEPEPMPTIEDEQPWRTVPEPVLREEAVALIEPEAGLNSNGAEQSMVALDQSGQNEIADAPRVPEGRGATLPAQDGSVDDPVEVEAADKSLGESDIVEADIAPVEATPQTSTEARVASLGETRKAETAPQELAADSKHAATASEESKNAAPKLQKQVQSSTETVTAQPPQTPRARKPVLRKEVATPEKISAEKKTVSVADVEKKSAASAEANDLLVELPKIEPVQPAQQDKGAVDKKASGSDASIISAPNDQKKNETSSGSLLDGRDHPVVGNVIVEAVAYADEPGARIAVVNEKIMHQGDRTGLLVLDKIESNRLIFLYKGERYFIPWEK